MENREFKNSTSGKTDINESFLASAAPAHYVRKYWKQTGVSESEIEKRTKEYQESLDKILKATKRFVYLVEKKYSYLDDPELIKKAIKFAKKHDMTTVETQTLIKFVLKGDAATTRWPLQEVHNTEMAKFLGYADINEPTIMPGDADKPDLNKLIELYEHSKTIHSVIKNQLSLYQDCAPEVLFGKYDVTRHSNSLYIHPLVAALYIPKVPALEKRTLWSNIGRMVLNKTPLYLGKQLANQEVILWNESAADIELSYDIARDPNSLQYVNKESPLSNLVKRFKIQIELWKNVHNLRQGKFFSSGEYDVDDSVTGFLKILNSYNWAYYDSPDMYQVQDEGTVLRKLLATFSIRPTFIQLTTPTLNWGGAGLLHANNYLNIGKVSFINTPVLNLRLPATMNSQFQVDTQQLQSALGNFGVNVQNPQPQELHLKNAFAQHDVFWENRTPTIKSKNVIYSKDFAFFYVNRKYQSINLLTASASMRYPQLTNNFNISGISQINTAEVGFQEDDFQIGSAITGNDSSFNLKSVVLVQIPPTHQYITSGCSSAFIKTAPSGGKLYFHYNPQVAGIMTLDENKKYEALPPITRLARFGDAVCFENLVRKYGTIYFYAH